MTTEIISTRCLDCARLFDIEAEITEDGHTVPVGKVASCGYCGKEHRHGYLMSNEPEPVPVSGPARQESGVGR